jgi:hypothetical protein
MIGESEIKKARNIWILASKRLGFEIISPYLIIINKTEIEVFAFLPHCGSRNGTIVELTSSPNFETDNRIIEWATVNEFFFSFINIDNCLQYNEAFFKETLEDWQKI